MRDPIGKVIDFLGHRVVGVVKDYHHSSLHDKIEPMKIWLQNFAFRIDITIWTFLIAAGLSLAISVLAVSYKSLQAATANPVDSLRYE